MNRKGRIQVEAWCAIGLAAALVVNGIAYFTPWAALWIAARICVVVLLLGVLPAIRARLLFNSAGWTEWVTNLAYLGVCAEALRWVGGLDLDSSWLFFGGLGVWSITVNILGLRNKLWPAALGWIGLASGVLILAVIPSAHIAGLAFLNTIASGLGAVVLYPIWLVWMGLRMRKE
jgi:hypothetical protein